MALAMMSPELRQLLKSVPECWHKQFLKDLREYCKTDRKDELDRVNNVVRV